MIGFVFGVSGFDRVGSCIRSVNAVSIRAAEKPGMALERGTVVPDCEVPCGVCELKAG